LGSAPEEGAGLETPQGLKPGSVEPGVWRYGMAKRASVVIDGEDYFALIQQAMLKAERRILLIGWDFDTRIHLSKGRRWWQKGHRSTYPSRLGSFVLWLARHNSGLDIKILKWSVGFLKWFARGYMLADILRWMPHKRIAFKFDNSHPIGGCHHQKIVVIDDDFAVCGGIDLTAHRWDTRDHIEDDPQRSRGGKNPYGPWHDMTMMMEGEIAGALDELGRTRWLKAGGGELGVLDPQPGSAWPDELEAQFENVEIGIARTSAEYDGFPQVEEIRELFVKQIASAKRFIYAENQYFASRDIAEAIAERMTQPDPPEVVVVHPQTADGRLEAVAMDPARARLVEALEQLDAHDRFHLFVPYTGETPIYVHAKLLIVDDRILRVGSANFNGRSMGLDSECDVFIDCARAGNGHCSEQIQAIRHGLLAEHCGLEVAEVAEMLATHGSMAAMIAHHAKTGGRHLRPFAIPESGEIEQFLADNEWLNPDHAEDLLPGSSHKRGLFRRGSLLARGMRTLKRKKRRR